MADKDEASWPLDKRIPISLILAILLQTIGVVWWGATMAEKVVVLKDRMDAIAPNSDRLTRVEVKVDTLLGSVSRIEAQTRKLP